MHLNLKHILKQNSNIFQNKIETQIYTKKMKISQKIIEKILNDNVFSIELAKRLGNQQQSILGLARRNSRNLTLWEAGKLYKEQGFTMKFTKNNYLIKTKLMNELIKITEENGQRAISARELHLFLEVQSKFADWIKNRINEYGFIENQDYMVFAEIGENSNGGRSLKEYALTLDMAKNFLNLSVIIFLKFNFFGKN